ncbi:hypothetical protein OC861_000515 [Tilletia horrida]|nr:hypothetical protein OC861_000515 [Tilletia horrida]
MSSSGRAAAHGSRNSAETLANAEALAPTVNNAAFALDSMKHLFTMAAVGLDSLLSRIPYSVHMEFWSGGNPSCAIIVVQWTGIINRQTTQKLQDGDKQHNEDVGKFEGADEDVPSAWGISASEWTNRGSDVFHKNSKATSGPGSAPSSPRLGSVAVHGSASPRFPASIGSSPRIRPTTGWSTPVSPGGTMNRAASYTGNSPSHQHHSNALGGRRTTVNKSGGNLIVSASLPGTPAISSSSKYSPFFGPVSGSAARASRSSGIQPWNEDGEEADGDDYFAKEKGSPSIFRPAMSSNDGRGRSASITSIPEISLGAAAISMRSHSITGTGPAETTGRGTSKA